MTDIISWPHYPSARSVIPSGQEPGGPDGWKQNLDLIQTTVNSKLDKDQKGQPSGVATLDGSGKLVQMPDKTDVGLGNVDNVKQATKAEFDEFVDDMQEALAGKVDKVSGKGLSTNDYTNEEKAKLAGIETGAEVNQNAFSKIKVSGQSDVDAGAKTDALILAGGTGISISTDAGTNTVTVTATGDMTPAAHATSHITGGSDVIPNAVANGNSGLMSGADKAKLDSVLAYPIATKEQAEAGESNDTYMTPLRTKQAIEELAPQPDLSDYARTDTRPTFKAGITDGDADSDVSHIQAYQHSIHGRTVVLVYTDGVLTEVTERVGGEEGTIVAKTTLTYDGGRLDQVETVADSVTVKRKLNYDESGRLTSVTPVA